jgi:hypothetical protein
VSKITGYAALATVKTDDQLVIVDIHDTSMASSGTTKKISVGTVQSLSWINAVTQFGADNTGATDNATVFGNIATAIGTSPAVVYLPAGTYKTSTGLPSLVQGQSIIGDGSSLTFVTYTGSGTCLSISVNGTFTGGQYAGRVQGVYMSGFTAGASAVGIQVEDLQGLTIDDVAVYGMGGKGIYYLHGTGWAEESTVRARIVQCGTYGTNTSGAVVFDGTSFDYSNFDFTIVTLPGTHGIILQNGAQLRGAKLRVRGNFYARTTANTGAVIAVAPAGGSDTSYITDASFDIAVESAGTGGQIGHTLLLMGSTNSGSQFTGNGVLSFNPFGPNTIFSQGISNANFVPIGISGYIQDGLTNGPPGNPGDALFVYGGSIWYPNGHLNSRPGGGVDVYWNFGDVCEGQLTNGNNSLVFHATSGGNFIRRTVLALAQPSTGAAGTVTWPAGTKWPGGTAPTLSSTNNFVDIIDFLYLPDTGFWYGTLRGTHYA